MRTNSGTVVSSCGDDCKLKKNKKKIINLATPETLMEINLESTSGILGIVHLHLICLNIYLRQNYEVISSAYR